METYLRKLIEGGENQHLDFKYCVSDSRKIAGIPTGRAEAIIANLMVLQILKMNASERGFSYALASTK